MYKTSGIGAVTSLCMTRILCCWYLLESSHGDDSGALQCYNCTDITNSLTCSSLVVCEKGEECDDDNLAPDIVGRSLMGGPVCHDCCDQELCNRNKCTLYQKDIEWGLWTEWDDCSRSCGNGIKVRIRQCTQPGGCLGNSMETRECLLTECTNTTWSDWSSWSRCSSTCNLGMKTRTRICHGNLDCTGHSTETAFCTQQQCADNTWSEWSNWSPCTVSCNTGLKSRTRQCIQFGGFCNGHSVETDFCARVPCSGYPFTKPYSTTLLPTVSSSIGNESTHFSNTTFSTKQIQNSTTEVSNPTTTSTLIPSRNTTPTDQDSYTPSTHTSSRYSQMTTRQTTIEGAANSSSSTVTSTELPSTFMIYTSASAIPNTTAFTNVPSTTTTVKCNSQPPLVDHAYITGYTPEMTTMKCLNGYVFTGGNEVSQIRCDASSQAWEQPFPRCKSLDNCTKNADCINSGTCDVGSTRCHCAEGYFNTNCDHVLQVGVAVVRGPDWKWVKQDGNGPGIITSLNGTRPHWIWVHWNVTGLEREYQVGFDGIFDLVPYKPSVA